MHLHGTCDQTGGGIVQEARDVLRVGTRTCRPDVVIRSSKCWVYGLPEDSGFFTQAGPLERSKFATGRFKMLIRVQSQFALKADRQ